MIASVPDRYDTDVAWGHHHAAILGRHPQGGQLRDCVHMQGCMSVCLFKGGVGVGEACLCVQRWCLCVCVYVCACVFKGGVWSGSG